MMRTVRIIMEFAIWDPKEILNLFLLRHINSWGKLSVRRLKNVMAVVARNVHRGPNTEHRRWWPAPPRAAPRSPGPARQHQHQQQGQVGTKAKRYDDAHVFSCQHNIISHSHLSAIKNVVSIDVVKYWKAQDKLICIASLQNSDLCVYERKTGSKSKHETSPSQNINGMCELRRRPANCE